MNSDSTLRILIYSEIKVIILEKEKVRTLRLESDFIIFFPTAQIIFHIFMFWKLKYSLFKRNRTLRILTAMTQNAVRRPLTAAAASEVQSGPHEAETVCSVQNLRRPRLLIQTLFCLDRFGTWRVSGRRPDRGAVRRQGAVAAARGVVDRRRVETILAQGRISQGRVPG